MESDTVEQVGKEMLRQMLNLQLQICDSYQDREHAVRAALIDLASHCVPDYIESCVKSGNPLENQPIDFLASILCQRFIQKYQVMVNLCSRLEQKVIPELEQSLLQEKANNAAHQQRISDILQQRNEEENSSMRGRSDSLVQIPGMELQRALSAFKQCETYERDCEALEIMGKTGYSRVPILKDLLATRWQISTSKARSIDECLNRLCDRSFIVIEQKTQQEQTSSGGRYPHILSLTALGAGVYQELFQEPPKPGTYDELIKRHKSPEHTLLIMQTADFLESEGYSVNRFPNRYLLDGGHYAEPDLTFMGVDQITKLLEIERGGNKSNRANKWMNLYYAGNKEIYVVTDNKKTMAQIRSEISKVLGTQEGKTYISNMFGILKGERATDGSIWLDVRIR